MCILFIYLSYKVINILNEEYKLLFGESDYNITSINITEYYIDYLDNADKYPDLSFDTLNILFFSLIAILFFIHRLSENIIRLLYFTSRCVNITNYTPKHDPQIVKSIANSLQKIGSFSLLRVIGWSRNELPGEFKKIIHIIRYDKDKDGNKNTENIDDIMHHFCCMCCCCIGCMFKCLPDISLYIFKSTIFTFMLEFILIFFIPIIISFLGLLIKVEQVSFVGNLEILEWNYSQLIQFLAFLNNLFALDSSNIISLDVSFTFLFAGEDACENGFELWSKKTFLNIITSYSIVKQGVFKSIIMLTQLNSTDIQKLVIEETPEYNLKSDYDKNISSRLTPRLNKTKQKYKKLVNNKQMAEISENTSLEIIP